MSLSESVIRIEHLSKTYRGGLLGKRSIHALRQVSLETRRGEIFGLLGPNGAGKTTLVKTLLGVIRPGGGSASIFGCPAGSIAARSRIGYLPESLRIDRHHTARSALRFYGGMSGLDRSAIAERVPDLLRLVGLEGRDRESVRRFSKGMYQRLGLAQALIHDPDLLILDEPTDGLDPVGRSEVRRLLIELKQRGKTIFLNSHILQEVELVCDRVAVMAGGRIRGVGTIEELTRRTLQGAVRLELVTDLPVDELQRALASPEELQVERIGDGRIGDGRMRATTVCADQPAIDALVDRVRAAGISIASLVAVRPTLEDVFLSLVGVPADIELVAPDEPGRLEDTADAMQEADDRSAVVSGGPG